MNSRDYSGLHHQGVSPYFDPQQFMKNLARDEEESSKETANHFRGIGRSIVDAGTTPAVINGLTGAYHGYKLGGIGGALVGLGIGAGHGFASGVPLGLFNYYASKNSNSLNVPNASGEEPEDTSLLGFIANNSNSQWVKDFYKTVKPFWNSKNGYFDWKLGQDFSKLPWYSKAGILAASTAGNLALNKGYNSFYKFMNRVMPKPSTSKFPTPSAFDFGDDVTFGVARTFNQAKRMDEASGKTFKDENSEQRKFYEYNDLIKNKKVSPEEAYAKTGVYKDLDGVLVTQGPIAEITDKRLDYSKGVPFNKVVKNHEEFEKLGSNYKSLKILGSGDEKSNYKGYYDPDTNTLVLNNELGITDGRPNPGTFGHEIEHVNGHADGTRALGTSPKNILRAVDYQSRTLPNKLKTIFTGASADNPKAEELYAKGVDMLYPNLRNIKLGTLSPEQREKAIEAVIQGYNMMQQSKRMVRLDKYPKFDARLSRWELEPARIIAKLFNKSGEDLSLNHSTGELIAQRGGLIQEYPDIITKNLLTVPKDRTGSLFSEYRGKNGGRVINVGQDIHVDASQYPTLFRDLIEMVIGKGALNVPRR